MPVASLTYVANGLTVDFTSTSTDATSWQWFFGDTDVFPLVSGSTIENPSHTYLAGGTYTLNLIVSNECGSDTISTTITVVGTGISSNSTDIAFNIYPNPAFESVMVSTKENAEIFLINELGQIILTTKSKRENTEISLLGLSKGIYTIKINSEEHTEQQILVIQ
jgi:PKD repeat protein